MSLQAFVDESRRNDRYLLAVAIIHPGDLTRLRKLLRSLLLPGQREVHFHNEKNDRRKIVLSRLVTCGPLGTSTSAPVRAKRRMHARSAWSR